ncbi:MAG: tRNA (adenosine(37)-N6)-threonylcarbamoyltransferase complex transferase subunit TsaD [Patescibacteria group bacterium]|nr:tRNA (adenosine(37)-N6)-threonylcarbamoyltransferase complex transferase subunit TsaD [Patescibacteria group bacterium]
MNVLGIDTTADDTCAAIVFDGYKILSNIVASQISLHRPFGGIVPQIASREHLKNIIPSIDQALNESGLSFKDIHLISVGQSPDPALSYYHIGITTAKFLAYVLNLPLVGVDHMEAHLFANFAVFRELKPPFISLTAAGGHTLLTLVRGYGDYEILGSTLDDAAGEAFDKAARILGLSYPGGPSIDEAAKEGQPGAYKFPRPMSHHRGYDFSYSGLKTAVYLKVKELKEDGGGNLSQSQTADVAAGFREAVVDSLLTKAFSAIREYNVNIFVLGGGVAANNLIRSEAESRGKRKGVKVYYPPKNLCTDNAVGTAVLGYFQYQRRGGSNIFELPYFRKSPLAKW